MEGCSKLGFPIVEGVVAETKGELNDLPVFERGRDGNGLSVKDPAVCNAG
jgi:hypothetical protein